VVVVVVVPKNLDICRIGLDLYDYATTRGGTVKRSGQAYSACKTGLEKEVLIVVVGGGRRKRILAMSPNRPRLRGSRHNQRGYGQMELTGEFSAQRRSVMAIKEALIVAVMTVGSTLIFNTFRKE
jgi:hypothetical protein